MKSPRRQKPEWAAMPEEGRGRDDSGPMVTAYLISGPVVYGALGWLADGWLGTGFLLPVGLLGGMAMSHSQFIAEANCIAAGSPGFMIGRSVYESIPVVMAVTMLVIGPERTPRVSTVLPTLPCAAYCIASVYIDHGK